ncbi:MAG: 23S rRNA (guanosine(2251)-2'-O)-methyltransferase RlmB [Clostridia bacterium]|nr:23S rRNA (guanosine(2251)-2'-O)-methyltransferase RlmB [Clostridia bacterium]
MIIEGKNSVLEALESNTSINKIILQNGTQDGIAQNIINLAKSRKINIIFLDKQSFLNLSPSKRPQGVIADIVDFDYSSVQDILSYATSKGEEPIIVILDGIEDPHNFGSVVRVCECAGVHGVIIPKNRAVEVNETVVRISAGALHYVKVARVTNINDTIKELKEKGVWVYSAEADGQNIYNTNLKGAIALIIGGENTGVKRLTKELSDAIISIPMYGKINSLNASVACGIVLYEAVRQRKGK